MPASKAATRIPRDPESAAAIPRVALSMDEAARSFGVSKPAVYQLAEAGVLKTFVIGKRRLVSVEALAEAVRTLESGATPAPSARSDIQPRRKAAEAV